MTANKLNLTDFIAMISGIAIIANLNKREPKEKKKVFPRDIPIFKGRASPIKMKLMMLKNVPRINPLPTALWPVRINTKPTKIAANIAREQYFFWVSLIASINDLSRL